MNSIKSISGLASSLLLNAGLTRIAEKLDPMQNDRSQSTMTAKSAIASEPCVFPCAFTPETGQ